MTRALLLPLALALAACQTDDAATDTPAAPSEVAETPAPPDASGETYRNDRFGYALVPGLPPAGPAPQSDDGRTFAGDGVTLTVAAYNDALAEGIDGVFARAREGIDRVTFRDTPPEGGVAVSGTAGDSTVYARGLYRDGVGVVARVRYLSGDEAGAAAADRVAQTLRWAAPPR